MTARRALVRRLVDRTLSERRALAVVGMSASLSSAGLAEFLDAVQQAGAASAEAGQGTARRFC